MWFATLTAVFALSCGANTGSGSSGSETHWLSRCDADDQCGEFSCLCGRCSVACEEDDPCDEPGTEVSALCVARDELRTSCDDGPARLCAREVDVSMVDTGTDENTTTDGGETTDPAQTDGAAETDETEQTDGAAETDSVETDAVQTDDEPVDVPNVDGGPICNGSDEVRLVIQNWTTGPVLRRSALLDVYPSTFIVVDGQCDFWMNDSRGGVRLGQIDDLALLEPYESTVSSMPGTREIADQCADALLTILWDPYGTGRASPCDRDAQTGDWRRLFDAMAALFDALRPISDSSTGPLRIVVGPEEDTVQETVPWPLALDLNVVETEDLVATDWLYPEIGALFQPGSDAELLRSTIADAGVSRHTNFTYDTNGASRTVGIQLRDELPPRVTAALKATTQLTNDTDGMDCTADTECGRWECSIPPGGNDSDGVCTNCLMPEDTEWACRSNEDCCDGLVCCVDCIEDRGRCLPAQDPCSSCLLAGGAWLPTSRECSAAACVPGATCFSEECPPSCSADDCDGCFNLGECWAAGCGWSGDGEEAACAAMSTEM